MAKILENQIENSEQKEVEIESKLYRMIEMLDAMKASLENAKKVKSEQELLIKVLKLIAKLSHTPEIRPAIVRANTTQCSYKP